MMKTSKLFLSCALLISAVVCSAVVYTPIDEPNSVTNLTEFVAYWKTVTAPQEKMGRKIQVIVQSEVMAGTTAATVAAIDGRLEALATENSVPANDVIFAKVYCYGNAGQWADSLVLAEANIAIPEVKNYIGYCYFYTNDFAKALPAFQYTQNIDMTIECLVKLNNKQLLFETVQSAALDSYRTAPALTKLINIIGDTNFKGTAVTDAMIIEFLQAVDRKYRKFVAVDEATWKPILGGIVHTLKAYGVEVTE